MASNAFTRKQTTRGAPVSRPVRVEPDSLHTLTTLLSPKIKRKWLGTFVPSHLPHAASERLLVVVILVIVVVVIIILIVVVVVIFVVYV